MSGILNSDRPLVYLKIKMDAPTATVMANNGVLYYLDNSRFPRTFYGLSRPKDRVKPLMVVTAVVLMRKMAGSGLSI